MLGVVLSVPLILSSGPLAGYLLGRFVIVKFFGLPEFSIPVFIGLGLWASGMQLWRIIQKIRSLDQEHDQKK